MIDTALLTETNAEELAKKSGQSPKTLRRRFKEALAHDQVVVIAYISPENLKRINENMEAFMAQVDIEGITEKKFRQHLGDRVAKVEEEATRNANQMLEAAEAAANGDIRVDLAEVGINLRQQDELDHQEAESLQRESEEEE